MYRFFMFRLQQSDTKNDNIPLLNHLAPNMTILVFPRTSSILSQLGGFSN